MSASSGETPQSGAQISEVDKWYPYCKIPDPEVPTTTNETPKVDSGENLTSHVQNCRMENQGNRYGNTTIRENYNPLDYFRKAFILQLKKEEQKPAT